jgi:hypothetical protein
MAGQLIQKGELTPIPNERFIFINPKKLDTARNILNEVVPRAYKTPIDYEVYTVSIGPEQLLALRSSDPKFYFGMTEGTQLHKAGIRNIVAEIEPRGGFAAVRSWDDVIRASATLGISQEAVEARLSRPETKQSVPVGPTPGQH